MSDCIVWRGAVAGGYGRKWRNGKVHQAHRLVWEDACGPIPEGMYVCHKCDNKLCQHVEHMFLGTHADNIRDMNSKKLGHNSSKTHCLRGHSLGGFNLIRRYDGHRECRACKREHNRESWRRLHGQNKQYRTPATIGKERT